MSLTICFNSLEKQKQQQHQQQQQHAHSTMQPHQAMHLSGANAGLSSTGHFLASPALASPVGSTTGTGTQPPNQPISANAPCSTLFVANLGQFVSEHELKEIFAR